MTKRSKKHASKWDTVYEERVYDSNDFQGKRLRRNKNRRRFLAGSVLASEIISE